MDRDGEVILKKYSPIGELGDFAQEYADSLYKTTGHVAIITDRCGCCGGRCTEKQWVDRPVVPVLEKSMESRKSMVLKNEPGTEEEQWDFAVHVIADYCRRRSHRHCNPGHH